MAESKSGDGKASSTSSSWFSKPIPVSDAASSAVQGDGGPGAMAPFCPSTPPADAPAVVGFNDWVDSETKGSKPMEPASPAEDRV